MSILDISRKFKIIEKGIEISSEGYYKHKLLMEVWTTD